MNNFQYPSGATPLDPDDMDGLKIKHITTRQELDRWEQDNINDAIQWLSRRRKADILTESFVISILAASIPKAGETDTQIALSFLILAFPLKELLLLLYE